MQLQLKLGGKGNGVECHFQQYFSYFVAVSFIGEGNRRMTGQEKCHLLIQMTA